MTQQALNPMRQAWPDAPTGLAGPAAVSHNGSQPHGSNKHHSNSKLHGGAAPVPLPAWRHKVRAVVRGAGWLMYVAAVFVCCIQREPRWWTPLPFVLPLGYWLGAYLAQRLGRVRWQWLFQGGLLLGVVALLLGLGRVHFGGVLSPQRIRLFYFLQEAVMLWLLLAVFARSLLPGKTPLCSAVAVLSHPVMTPAVWRYTRGVTLAWALWIAGLWLVSASLFVVASAQTWAFFSMGVLPVLIAVFFVAEVLLGRRVFLPKADRSSLWATLATVRKVNWTTFFMQLFQDQAGQPAPGAPTPGMPQATAGAASQAEPGCPQASRPALRQGARDEA